RQEIVKSQQRQAAPVRWASASSTDEVLAFWHGQADAMLPDLKPLWDAMYRIGGSPIPQFPENPSAEGAEPYRTLRALQTVERWAATSAKLTPNFPVDQPNERDSRAAPPETWKPGYTRPSDDRLAAAIGQLSDVEQFIAPESAVLASLLVRVLLNRGCTTAE